MIKFLSFVESQALIGEGILNPAFVGDEDIKKLDGWISNPSKFKKDKQQIVDLIATVFSKHEPMLKKIRSKFESAIKKELRKYKKSKFLSDSKEMDSIIDKAVDRARGFGELNDLVRGAVLLDNKAEADDFVKRFMRKNSRAVVGYEEKKRGEDNTYGYYGSHHIDLNIDGIIVELQVMTKKLWQYKEVAHDIYTSNRSKGTGPDAFDRHTSKKIFSIAAMKSESVESMPEFTLGEMHEMQFDKFEEVLLED